MENPTGAGSVSKHPHANKGDRQRGGQPNQATVACFIVRTRRRRDEAFFWLEEDMSKDADWRVAAAESQPVPRMTKT